MMRAMQRHEPGQQENRAAAPGWRYVAITPVKDEAAHLPRLLETMTGQTIRPLRWVLVDDGSSDGTGALLDDFSRRWVFARVLHRPAGRPRAPGPAVIDAFHSGLAMVDDLPWDFIVKLDGDLSLDADYFERLLACFAASPTLGIASGVYWEQRPGRRRWREIRMPDYHAAGAAKTVRRACWETIGGFIPAQGWDTVDELRARAAGWDTRHFRNLRMRHWKPEGSGIGVLRTSRMHGAIFYRTGGTPLLFAAKFLRRCPQWPWLAGALAMLWGYMRAAGSRQRLVSEREAAVYRQLLLRRCCKRRAPGRTRGASDRSSNRTRPSRQAA